MGMGNSIGAKLNITKESIPEVKNMGWENFALENCDMLGHF
jgi:hypothetical protein